MNGANSDGKNYQPDTTSYDYDAPLSESGEPAAKYFLFRDVIRKATGITPPPVPGRAAPRSFPVSMGVETASLWHNLPQPVESDTLLTMEDLDQAYGYILYRTSLQPGMGGDLVLNGLHDYAQIYINQELVGTLDRRLGQTQLSLPVVRSAATLDILVENSGRVNFTTALRGERKGITGGVTLAGKAPQHWQIYSLPMRQPSSLRFLPQSCSGPCFYRAKMQVAAPADTFLDTRSLHKGELWINDRPLGRFWSIGPQYSLYLPGPWLSKGANTLIYFDLQGGPQDHVHSVPAPIFERPAPTRKP